MKKLSIAVAKSTVVYFIKLSATAFVIADLSLLKEENFGNDFRNAKG